MALGLHGRSQGLVRRGQGSMRASVPCGTSILSASGCLSGAQRVVRARVAKPLSDAAPKDNGSVAVKVSADAASKANSALYIAGPFGSGRLSQDGARVRASVCAPRATVACCMRCSRAPAAGQPAAIVHTACSSCCTVSVGCGGASVRARGGYVVRVDVTLADDDLDVLEVPTLRHMSEARCAHHVCEVAAALCKSMACTLPSHVHAAQRARCPPMCRVFACVLLLCAQGQPLCH
jgi:hypothetical protein